MKTKPERFGRRYPWDRWLRSGFFRLRRGTDYTIMTHGMAQMVRNVASRRRLKIHLEILSDHLIEVHVLGPKPKESRRATH